MSNWINIDKLGTVGATPDKSATHKEPPALDVGMNIRAVGPNLANAGGFLLVSGLPEHVPKTAIGQVNVTQFLAEVVFPPDDEVRVTQFLVEVVYPE